MPCGVGVRPLLRTLPTGLEWVEGMTLPLDGGCGLAPLGICPTLPGHCTVRLSQPLSLFLALMVPDMTNSFCYDKFTKHQHLLHERGLGNPGSNPGTAINQ